jgi:uncharacterized membrane protein
VLGLGAHTRQDVVLHQGTQGLADLGVDRALWIGTPNGSRWRTEVHGSPASPTSRDQVAEFDDYDQYLALPVERREALRYVMITHAEDGVPKFGPPLAVQSPDWLRQEPRPEGILPALWRRRLLWTQPKATSKKAPTAITRLTTKATTAGHAAPSLRARTASQTPTSAGNANCSPQTAIPR